MKWEQQAPLSDTQLQTLAQIAHITSERPLPKVRVFCCWIHCESGPLRLARPCRKRKSAILDRSDVDSLQALIRPSFSRNRPLLTHSFAIQDILDTFVIEDAAFGLPITNEDDVYSLELSAICMDPFTAPIDLLTLSSQSTGNHFPEEDKYLPYMYVDLVPTLKSPIV